MATIATRIQVLTVALPAKTGSLLGIFQKFKETNVNVLATWAYEMGPGNAQGHFYCANTDLAKTVLLGMSLKPTVENAVHVEGEDRVGVYAEQLSRISKAHISINATDAFSINGKFACVFFVDAKDFQALCKVLGC